MQIETWPIYKLDIEYRNVQSMIFKLKGTRAQAYWLDMKDKLDKEISKRYKAKLEEFNKIKDLYERIEK